MDCYHTALLWQLFVGWVVHVRSNQILIHDLNLISEINELS